MSKSPSQLISPALSRNISQTSDVQKFNYEEEQEQNQFRKFSYFNSGEVGQQDQLLNLEQEFHDIVNKIFNIKRELERVNLEIESFKSYLANPSQVLIREIIIESKTYYDNEGNILEDFTNFSNLNLDLNRTLREVTETIKQQQEEKNEEIQVLEYQLSKQEEEKNEEIQALEYQLYKQEEEKNEEIQALEYQLSKPEEEIKEREEEGDQKSKELVHITTHKMLSDSFYTFCQQIQNNFNHIEDKLSLELKEKTQELKFLKLQLDIKNSKSPEIQYEEKIDDVNKSLSNEKIILNTKQELIFENLSLNRELELIKKCNEQKIKEQEKKIQQLKDALIEQEKQKNSKIQELKYALIEQEKEKNAIIKALKDKLIQLNDTSKEKVSQKLTEDDEKLEIENQLFTSKKLFISEKELLLFPIEERQLVKTNRENLDLEEFISYDQELVLEANKLSRNEYNNQINHIKNNDTEDSLRKVRTKFIETRQQKFKGSNGELVFIEQLKVRQINSEKIEESLTQKKLITLNNHPKQDLEKSIIPNNHSKQDLESNKKLVQIKQDSKFLNEKSKLLDEISVKTTSEQQNFKQSKLAKQFQKRVEASGAYKKQSLQNQELTQKHDKQQSLKNQELKQYQDENQLENVIVQENNKFVPVEDTQQQVFGNDGNLFENQLKQYDN
ncbi:MAG: hypothetical protein U1E31_02260 [Rickettsiales bacterium]